MKPVHANAMVAAPQVKVPSPLPEKIATVPLLVLAVVGHGQVEIAVAVEIAHGHGVRTASHNGHGR